MSSGFTGHGLEFIDIFSTYECNIFSAFDSVCWVPGGVFGL